MKKGNFGCVESHAERHCGCRRTFHDFLGRDFFIGGLTVAILLTCICEAICICICITVGSVCVFGAEVCLAGQAQVLSSAVLSEPVAHSCLVITHHFSCQHHLIAK